MVINVNEDIYYAYLSSYNPVASTYDIIFAKDGERANLPNLVFNKDIFGAYQDDPELNSSQNLRLRNITIALGLWGSLYNSFDTQDISPMAARGILKFFVRVVKSVFIAVAVIATVVAVVVAPIVTFINPAAGAVVMKAAQLVAAASTAIVMGLTKLEEWLDDGKSNPTISDQSISDPLTPPENMSKTIMISVMNVYDDKEIKNEIEYHIGKEKDVFLKFSSPSWNTTGINTLEDVFKNNYLTWGYEKRNDGSTNDSITLRNSWLFNISLVKDSQNSFFVRIKRTKDTGSVGNGTVAFAFEFAGNDIKFNSEFNVVEYKYFNESKPEMHINMFVVRFCVNPDCPDYLLLPLEDQ